MNMYTRMFLDRGYKREEYLMEYLIDTIGSYIWRHKLFNYSSIIVAL